MTNPILKWTVGMGLYGLVSGVHMLQCETTSA